MIAKICAQKFENIIKYMKRGDKRKKKETKNEKKYY